MKTAIRGRVSGLVFFLSQQILRGNYAFLSPRWASISSSAKDLIRRFLQVNPSRRITAGDALHAEWLDDDAAKGKLVSRLSARLSALFTAGDTLHAERLDDDAAKG